MHTRAVLALIAGLLAFLGVAGSLGLLGGNLVAVADNGDGPRLACGARLVADTPDRLAPWHGVAVVDYRTGGPGCTSPYPSSAGPLLRATVSDPDDPAGRWSTVRPGLLYAALLALGVAVAALAASARAASRAVVVILPVLPLVVVPWWSRFFVSTYAEPAGLLGAAWVVLGGLAIAVTTPFQYRSRLVALGLVAVGGVVAGTAKPGFLPVLAASVVVAAITGLAAPDAARPRLVRRAGPLLALVVVAACVLPVGAALRWEDVTDADVNTHNLVFTAVLTEIGPGAAPAVGLPAAAAARSGEGFYWRGAAGIPGWDATIGTRPDDVRAAALDQLAAHPDAAARMLARGLTATRRPQLTYLSSAPRGTAPERDERRTTAPEAGMVTATETAWLDGARAGWLPAAIAVTAILAGLATLRRGRAGTRVTLLRGAALTATAAVGVVGLAVLGDGYFELTKHVWLASYLLVLAALVLATALAAAAVRLAQSFRRRGAPVNAGGTGVEPPA